LSYLIPGRTSLSLKPADEIEQVPIRFKDDVYNPEPDQMANLLLTACLTRMGKPLPAEYSSILLHVLEAYRIKKDKIHRLRERVQIEQSDRVIAENKLEAGQSDWAKERELLQAENKRLELIIAKGKNGMATLAKARAASVVQRDGRRRRDTGTRSEEAQQSRRASVLSTETALLMRKIPSQSPLERWTDADSYSGQLNLPSASLSIMITN
jgi:ribosomal protein L12E/L44/L45/RPP1/RPP2